MKQKIIQWEDEKYEKNTKYFENLKFETDQGELVRSKSEVIIANLLYQNLHHILYKYERPLELNKGKDVILTYETQNNPLEISVVKRMIKELV